MIQVQHINIIPGFERMNGELAFSRPAIIEAIGLKVIPPAVAGEWEKLAGVFYLDNNEGQEFQLDALIHLDDDPDFEDIDLESSEIDIAWRKQSLSKVEISTGRFPEWNYEDKLQMGPYMVKAIIHYRFQ